MASVSDMIKLYPRLMNDLEELSYLINDVETKYDKLKTEYEILMEKNNMPSNIMNTTTTTTTTPNLDNNIMDVVLVSNQQENFLNQIADLEAELRRYESRNSELNIQLRNITDEKTTVEYESKNIYEQLTTCSTMLNELNSQRIQENDELISQMKSLSDEKRQLEADINAKDNNLIDMMTQYNDAIKINQQWALDYEMLQSEYETNKDENYLLRSNIQKLQQMFNSPNTEPDLLINDIQNKLTKINRMETELQNVRSENMDLEISIQNSESYVTNLIAKLDRNMSAQLQLINTDLQTHELEEQFYKDNPLIFEDMIPMTEYTFLPINETYKPFLNYISLLIHQNNPNTKTIYNNDDELMSHTYMILIYKLLGIYSSNYIRDYISYVYSKCQDIQQKERTNEPSVILLSELPLPQTFQTNSLYYLLNRYNSKAYNPDRVIDFGNTLAGLFRPEFRVDTTQALNLFQPNIGKRYNNILIYTPETIEILQKLRETLQKL